MTRFIAALSLFGMLFAALASGAFFEKTRSDKVLIEAINKRAEIEREYTREIAEIRYKMADDKQRYSAVIATITNNHATELQQHAARTEQYDNLPEARTAKLRELAKRYDRVIADGREMAARCSAGIEARERAITELINRINRDVRLVNDGQ